MVHLIDKDTLVTEIERLQDSIKATAIDGRISKEQAEAYKVCVKLRSFVEDTLKVEEVDLEKEEDKLDKAIKLADAMYDAAQRLTTDASRLHKAMQDWWNFKNFSL